MATTGGAAYLLLLTQYGIVDAAVAAAATAVGHRGGDDLAYERH